MQIRTATSADLAAVVQIEAECFPAAEAATELSLARRLALYPNHFWVLMDGKQLVGFVNGIHVCGDSVCPIHIVELVLY